MRQLIAVLSLFCLTLPVAWSQSTLTQNLSAKKPPKLSGNLGLSYNSDFIDQDSNIHTASASGTLTLNYNVGGRNLIRLFQNVDKEVTQGEEWKPSDGFVAWVNNGFWRQGEILTIGQQVRASYPASENSRKGDSRHSGVSLVPVFTFNLTPVGATGLAVIYQPQITKNFHTYTTNQSNTNNVSVSTNHLIVLNYDFMDNWYAQGLMIYGMAWSYGGAKRDDVWQNGVEIGRWFDSGLTIAAGANNSGSIASFQNGPDKTIQIFDNKTAVFYTAIYYSF